MKKHGWFIMSRPCFFALIICNFGALRFRYCASGTMQLLNDWADCADIKDREPVRATGTQDRNDAR